jgi:hypothetical protein
MSRKKSRKKSADAKILQKLNEIDREFKSMERFRLSMVKSRKTRIMKRIKKGEPADYKGYKKELTARVKTHLTRVNKSIKAYSKILKKKSRKPRKKSRKPRKKSMKKSKRKKMRMCACGVNHFHMKKAARLKKKSKLKKKSRPRNERMDKFLRQIIDALKICSIHDSKIYHFGKPTVLSQVIAGQDFAKHKIFSRFSNNKTPFEVIEAALGGMNRKVEIKRFYDSWLCSYANHVKEQARLHKEKQDDKFLGSHEFGKLSVDKNTSDLAGALRNLKLE